MAIFDTLRRFAADEFEGDILTACIAIKAGLEAGHAWGRILGDSEVDPAELAREYERFMRDGAALFAPVER